MKKFAFTLAETLIVIGVIGIVSALTLPNLNSSTGNKEKVAKVKKLYQNLQDGFGRATAIYGPIDTWFITDDDNAAQTRFAERMLDYFKVSKTCFDTNTISCTEGNKHKLLNGNDSGQDTRTQKSVLLADGSGLTFSILSKECNNGGDTEESNFCGLIVVDIDGANGANVFGKDTFTFWVKKDGIYPAGYNDSSLGQRMRSGEIGICKGKIILQNGCAGWVTEYDNMDYLKTDNHDNCPNGVQLSGTNPSCK